MRIAWSFDNYSFHVNPEEDSGWVVEPVVSNRVPIGGNRSRIQIGGIKSATRQISGWIYGPGSAIQYNNMRRWVRDRVVSTLTDHLGESRRAIMISFQPQAVRSASEWAAGRQAYKYTATFLALD